MLQQALEENRDDVIPVVTSAIEKNEDPDWIVDMIMSPEFPKGAVPALALLPVKRVLERFKQHATPEEKTILDREEAGPYLEKVQNRLIEARKRAKKLEEQFEKMEEEEEKKRKEEEKGKPEEKKPEPEKPKPEPEKPEAGGEKPPAEPQKSSAKSA
jgi:hypothetical protein